MHKSENYQSKRMADDQAAPQAPAALPPTGQAESVSDFGSSKRVVIQWVVGSIGV